MKKFIKKTIAGLIAGVMAVSSMPFVALADDTTALESAKSALSTFSYNGIKTQEGNWYNSSNSKMSMPSETYANLLFAGDSKTDYGAFTNDSDSTKGYLRYQKSVFLYDDITTPRAPIMVVYGATKDANRYIGAITLSDNQSNALKLIGNWKCSRNKNYGNNWDYPNVWAMNGSDDIQPGIDVNNPTSAQIAGSGFLNNWNVQPGMSNKMEYQGSFASGTYTQDITLTVDFYQGGNSGQLGNVHDTIVGTEKCYAVNYKAVLDTIDTAKKQITTVSYDKYTEASVNAYASAVNELVKFDPTTLTFNADTLATDVETAGTKISELITAYGKAYDSLEEKVVLKYEALNAAIEDAKATYEADNEKGMYTDDSFASFKAAYEAAVAKVGNGASQDDVDETAKALVTAQNELVRAKFEVTFYTVSDDATDPVVVKTEAVEYGSTFEASQDSNVERWVVETDNGDTTTTLNTYEKSVSVVITKDAKIYAYLSSEAPEAVTSKVTFYGKNNQVVAVRYIADGYTLNTSEVEVPEIPFYSTTGWDVESVTGDGKDYSVRAVYTCTQTEDDMCTVHFGDWSKAYSYDSYVYLPKEKADPSKKYALYSDEACTELLTYIEGVDFYAPKTKNIYVKEVTEAEQKASIGVTGSFSQTYNGKRAAVFNCKFFLPEGATAVEWGLEVKLNGKTAKVKAESKSERNEYSVRLSTSNSAITSVDGRAYLVYKDSEGTHTIYSSETYVNQTL